MIIDGLKMTNELQELIREYYEDICTLQTFNSRLKGRLSRIYENCNVYDFQVLFEATENCSSSVEETIKKVSDTIVLVEQLLCKYEEYLKF